MVVVSVDFVRLFVTVFVCVCVWVLFACFFINLDFFFILLVSVALNGKV